eukprot:CAMPEP_0205903910 /NCGR_PEP_ID=MMETSP1325-20131115/398_1 /ASSEMBLY_ACC=CAM_ASM_000708 /TAXON_ID=236786 /ORGANISM="Florenciella sp., Strain RCC1007" /LENGTH=89 /DNA_ID=CAMNT_0053269617 /DNA_START=142 /DNA_END=408 /DNA_ORIENTATION=-
MTESSETSDSHSDHHDFLASLKTPYQLGRDGRIRTIRKLDRKPPAALIPHTILQLQRDYERGAFASDARKLGDVRKRLRRYHLVDATAK